MIRDKNGKSPWVKARKKPGRKSQTSKDFDDEWRMENGEKNLAETNKG